MADKTNENDQNNKDESRELTDAEKKQELEDLFKDFMEVLFNEDKKENGEIEEEEEPESEEEKEK